MVLPICRQRPSQERLLESFLELVVDVAKADRGIILLAEEGETEMRPAAVHFLKDEDDDEDDEEDWDE
jgi:hypothetical protein